MECYLIALGFYFRVSNSTTEQTWGCMLIHNKNYLNHQNRSKQVISMPDVIPQVNINLLPF